MQSSVKIALSDDFLRCFAGIPRDRQNAVLKFIAQFRDNPTSRGINYEKINDAVDKNMRSVRIDQNYRGIVLKPERGNVYCLLWVAKHDDAYDWARRHRVAINPEGGNIQVFEASHHQEPSDVARTARKPGLFATLKDRELVRLGVPEDVIAMVRGVGSEEALDALQHQIPDDAYEALFMYAAGSTYEELVRERELPAQVDTADFAKALTVDASKRHFLVITDDVDLEALLAAPLEMWRVFLHPMQRKLVERDWNGPVRVLGGAGTGKTVVAMHRAVWLARNKYAHEQGKPVLFTTFTRTLADDIRAHIAMIASPAERERIEVLNVDQWVKSILRRFGYRPELLFDERRRRDFWARALTRKPDDTDYRDAFCRAEFERVVLPQGCESAEDYMKASRIGRGKPLSRLERQNLWPVFAEYRSQLRAANFREPEEAYRDALALIKKEGTSLGIRSIVVDETQDLSPSALALLRAAVAADRNDMFLVGDAHQRIYRHRASLSKVGIDIRGRGRRLRVNYRTTDEIRRWAAAQLAGCLIDDLDGQPDTLAGYKSLTHGPTPDDAVVESRELERKSIADTLRTLESDGVKDMSICIAVRTNEEAVEYAEWLETIGKKAFRLERDVSDDQTTPGVRVATMHRVKGLEFDAVIMAGYKGPEYWANTYAEEADAGAYVDVLTSERCLLHVAATRARRYLMVRKLVMK